MRGLRLVRDEERGDGAARRRFTRPHISDREPSQIGAGLCCYMQILYVLAYAGKNKVVTLN